MKKYIIVFLMLILMTGCSKGNSLKCTSTEVVSENTYKNEIKFTFKDDKVSKAKLTMDVILGEAGMKNYDLYYNAFEQTFAGLNDEEGVKVELKKNDKGYKVIIDADYSKYKGQLDMINSSLNKDQTKVYYENIKYKCK